MDSTQRFSTRVEAYVKYRPGYPAAMLDFLARELAMGPESQVADIGAGTGILTALLAPRVARVWAVEPNDDMRAAAKRLLAQVGNIGWLHGSAEATGLPTGAMDLVTVAQAFHWFDRAAFRQECQRLLKPGGQVALIWNDRLTNTPFLKAMSQLRVAWGAPAPHASNVVHSLPARSAPTSFANPDNFSDSGSLPHGTAPSTLSTDGDIRLHAGYGTRQPHARLGDCARPDGSLPALC